MKQITAIVRPERFNAVTQALTKAGVNGMTIFEVKGRGAQKGIKLQGRGRSHEIPFLEKVEIMMVVPDSDLDKVICTVLETARTDRGPGDGKIFVSNVDEVIRIRTGERNGESVC